MKTRLAIGALGLCALATVACYVYRPVTGALASELESPRNVRLTRADGSTERVRAAHVVGDSLVGLDQWSRHIAVAVTDVRSVETETDSSWSTMLIVALVVTFVAGAIASHEMGNILAGY